MSRKALVVIDIQNDITKHYRDIIDNITAAVQKTLLRDGSLVVCLEGEDLTRTAHFNTASNFGSHTIKQTN